VFADLPADEPQGGDKDLYIDALIGRAQALVGKAAFERVLKFSLEGILADIRGDLEEFRVTFDCWFSERSLGDSGAIDRAIDALKASGHAYLKDGALWFKSTDFGDEKDRVMVRENGAKTYRVHIEQAGARVRTPAVRVGRRSPWLHRADAGRLGGPRRPGRMLRSQAHPGRDVVSRG
jgi:hypothetical protein